MDFHDDDDDDELKWDWIIEYLASVNQVTTSILYDLIEFAHKSVEDLGKNARERIALRCLEELFSPGDGVMTDDTSNLDMKICFDFSESCEDVLQCIVREASMSDLKVGGLAPSKWNVDPFIIHKRASLPKCALQELKDAIVGDNYPQAGPSTNESGNGHDLHKSGSEKEVPHDTHRTPQDLIVESDAVEQRSSNGFPVSIKHGHDDSTDELDKVDQNSSNADGISGGRMDICEEEMSTASGGCNDERIKAHLNSQFKLSQNSLESADLKKQNVCAECSDKNGELLICSTNSCLLVIHEKCIGSPANFDEKGHFYCPVCAYSQVVSEYREVERETSLARKELATFIGMGFDYHPEDPTRRSVGNEHDCSKKHNLGAEIHEDGDLGAAESSSKKQQHIVDIDEPSASCFSLDLLPRAVEEENASGDKVSVFSGEKEGMSVQEAELRCSGGNLSSKEVGGKQKEEFTKAGVHDEALQQHVPDTKEENVCILDIDEDGKYFISFRNR